MTGVVRSLVREKGYGFPRAENVALLQEAVR